MEEQMGDKQVCTNVCLRRCKWSLFFFLTIKLPRREKHEACFTSEMRESPRNPSAAAVS